jgi:thiol-disulfide isomerase/thioredoxin
MGGSMKRFWTILITLLIAGCSNSVNNPKTQPGSAVVLVGKTPGNSVSQSATVNNTIQADLKDLGPAPELTNTVWLNTDQPLRLTKLRGSVVLLEMWTFDCINCQHVIPSLMSWYEKYHMEGLVIIGNHYPEFDYEADLNALEQAVTRLDIPFPVAQDNDGKTWNAYNNRYWPTLYLIDKQGNIRYEHIGEGSYSETEGAIQTLLAETFPG